MSFRIAPYKLNTKNKFFQMQGIIHVFEIPTILYINSLRPSVYDGGFGGGGRERPVKQRATR